MKKVVISRAVGNLGGSLAKCLAESDVYFSLMIHNKDVNEELRSKLMQS